MPPLTSVSPGCRTVVIPGSVATAEPGLSVHTLAPVIAVMKIMNAATQFPSSPSFRKRPIVNHRLAHPMPTANTRCFRLLVGSVLSKNPRSLSNSEGFILHPRVGTDMRGEGLVAGLLTRFGGLNVEPIGLSLLQDDLVVLYPRGYKHPEGATGITIWDYIGSQCKQVITCGLPTDCSIHGC